MFNTAFQAPFRALFNVVAVVTYLLRDEFTTAEAAPIASPRTCEPGPGTITVTDTNSIISISGDKVVLSGTPAISDGLRTNITRAAGRCFKFNLASGTLFGNGNQIMGFYRVTGAYWFGYRPAIGQMRLIVNSTTLLVGSYTTTPIVLYTITRGSAPGAFAVFSTGGVTRLGWVDNGLPDITYAWWYFSTNPLNFTGDYWRISDLPAPWNTDYGIATSYSASANAGDTAIMEADAIIEVTWQAATGETYELDIRRTDNDNRWIIRCSQAGSTIKLIERNAGVETERGSAAQTWVNNTNYRIVAMADTQEITTWVNLTQKNLYTSAAFNQSATGVKTSHAVTNLVAYPRILSGAALAALEAI